MKYLNLYLFLIILLPVMATAQPVIGTLKNDSTSLQGYTFFSPYSGTKAYIVNNCGRLVKEWDRGTRPGLAAYFLENGLMLRTYKVTPNGPYTSASNAGGLELVDWANNTIWSYEWNTATELTHHDAVYMPSGNILLLVWELVYTADLVAWGRDPNEIAVEGYMWSEKIVEIETVGNNGINIVWEWRIKDHYIQDFDSTKSNYGVVEDHPELFDINLPDLNSSNSNATRDWNHFNSIDYNEDLDQILISIRNSDEIWIIDHSTTTAEAATHSGGQYGKGGDLLYRWGNASAYRRAPVSDQKLFGQHGAHWIKEGLDDAGKILIYNNGNGRPGTNYSSTEIIDPPVNGPGDYVVPAGLDPFGPTYAEWSYGNGVSEDYYSPYLSNSQRLPNGNTLINAGSPGYVFEIDAQRNVVWEYEIPLNGDFPGMQGIPINNNSVFRVYKYAPWYSGFDGLDLTPGLPIESGTDTANCQVYTETPPPNGINTASPPEGNILYYQVRNLVVIENPKVSSAEFLLVGLDGRVHLSEAFQSANHEVKLPELCSGIYLGVFRSGGQYLTRKIFVN